MGFISDILAKLADVVDAVVPVGQGSRTKIAALVAVLGPVLKPAILAVSPRASAVLDLVENAAAALVPVFAAAGLFRKA